MSSDKPDEMTLPSSRPVVSVIIVTWNGKRYALECLESLHAHRSTFKTELIVVDNGSSDGTAEAIRLQFPGVKLIENQANLGFAKANNIGIAISRGDYVCLLNSDVVVPPGCLEEIVKFMDANPDIGLLGPKMLNTEGGVGASVMRLPTVWNALCCALGFHRVFSRSKLLGGFEMAAYPYDSIDDVEVLTGWFWVTWRAALSQVGGLDERFFMYGEDIDWCRRFRNRGWRVVFYPDAKALHYGAASSASQPVRFYVEKQRANLQYFRKHHGVLSCLGYLLVCGIHHMARVLGYAVMTALRPSGRSEALFKLKRSWACLMWLARVKKVLSPSPARSFA